MSRSKIQTVEIVPWDCPGASVTLVYEDGAVIEHEFKSKKEAIEFVAQNIGKK